MQLNGKDKRFIWNAVFFSFAYAKSKIQTAKSTTCSKNEISFDNNHNNSPKSVYAIDLIHRQEDRQMWEKKKHDHYTDYRIEYMPSRANGIKNKLLKYFKFNFNGELKGSTTKWMELNESINGQSLNKQKFIKYMDNERKSSWIFNNGE